MLFEPCDQLIHVHIECDALDSGHIEHVCQSGIPDSEDLLFYRRRHCGNDPAFIDSGHQIQSGAVVPSHHDITDSVHAFYSASGTDRPSIFRSSIRVATGYCSRRRFNVPLFMIMPPSVLCSSMPNCHRGFGAESSEMLYNRHR